MSMYCLFTLELRKDLLLRSRQKVAYSFSERGRLQNDISGIFSYKLSFLSDPLWFSWKFISAVLGYHLVWVFKLIHLQTVHIAYRWLCYSMNKYVLVLLHWSMNKYVLGLLHWSNGTNLVHSVNWHWEQHVFWRD